MSAEEFALDVIHGNFSHALKRLEDWVGTIPASVKALEGKLATDAGKIVSDLAKTAATDIIAGGVINTAAYVKAGTDIFAKLPADGVLLLSDVFAILNAEVSYLLSQNPSTPAAGDPVTTP